MSKEKHIEMLSRLLIDGFKEQDDMKIYFADGYAMCLANEGIINDFQFAIYMNTSGCVQISNKDNPETISLIKAMRGALVA